MAGAFLGSNQMSGQDAKVEAQMPSKGCHQMRGYSVIAGKIEKAGLFCMPTKMQLGNDLWSEVILKGGPSVWVPAWYVGTRENKNIGASFNT